ncbi:MAG: L,D-transpeptidase family protein [Prolixibacteraceae bacterium]|nr:L,D-transpeptidase family protein [Prolixibacteraceae bacterium]
MRLLFILLVPCLLVCIINKSAKCKEHCAHEKKALRIAKKNAVLLDSINQLLVVFNEIPESSSAVLIAMEKRNKVWRIVSAPIAAGVGRKGFAGPGAKREGDQQTPTGFFRLGQLFCYEKDVKTRMPFIQTTADDKWIDDTNSIDYNRHVRGETQAKSYEKLKIRSDEYKYCMVIEYNTHPVVKDMGSAIFLHLSEGEKPNPSAGCVVVTHGDMEWLLSWMNPESKPSILMGNNKVLMSEN